MNAIATARNNIVGTDGGTALDRDTVFGLLSNSRRRAVLLLLDEEGPMDKATLIDYVAEWEYGRPIADVSAQERKRVHVSLHQAHVPKLTDHDVVTVTGDTFALGENAEECLDHIRQDTLADRIRNLI